MKTFALSVSISNMLSDPIFALLYFVAAAYIFKMWYNDLRMSEKPKNAFPGTEYASRASVIIAVAGAVVLLAVHTFAEIAAGVDNRQDSLAIWALFSITAAAFIEELIFRGYFVIQNKGGTVLVLSIFAFSFLFAIFHPYFWDYTTQGGLVFDFGIKPAISTGFIFLNSLWFYAARFLPFNPKRSLIPCIAAHLAYNWGVYIVKCFQGFA